MFITKKPRILYNTLIITGSRGENERVANISRGFTTGTVLARNRMNGQHSVEEPRQEFKTDPLLPWTIALVRDMDHNRDNGTVVALK